MRENNDVLERAKKVQREVASGHHIWMNMAFFQDLIAEIERLRALVNETRALVDEPEGEQE